MLLPPPATGIEAIVQFESDSSLAATPGNRIQQCGIGGWHDQVVWSGRSGVGKAPTDAVIDVA
jgi:hypothetical protein